MKFSQIFQVFSQVLHALLVFEAYRRKGYYSLSFQDLAKAVRTYFSEKRKLHADVLSRTKYGLPAGTLMCSRDQGWLPTDIGFPTEMAEIRATHQGIGYLGKFAVVPFLQGGRVGLQLLTEAVGSWAPANGVRTLVMMVHPDHAFIYKRRYGAHEIARTAGTEGLEKAPAVLLILELTNSFRRLHLT